MFSLFYLLVKTTKRDFRNIKHAEIKQVLSFKQVSVTLSNFLNRKNKKQEKNRFQNLPKMTIKNLKLAAYFQTEIVLIFFGLI